MYQLTNYGGSGLQVVTPDPPDAGGAAINANFKALATQVATSNPGVDDDSTAGFGVGSRWYNSATTVEWICLDATPGDAEWAAVASGALAGYLPLTGGTLTGALAMGGNPINMDAGTGTGGGSLNMEGGSVMGCSALLGYAGLLRVPTTVDMLAYTLNMYDGSGSHGGTLNMDGGTVSNCMALYLQTLYAYAGPTVGVDCGISMIGHELSMYDGSGSGGGTLNMDGGNIYGSAAGTGQTGGTLNLGDGTGSHGGTLNMEGGNIYGSAPSSGQTGGTWNLGDGSGSNGGTLNMDGGSISNAGNIKVAGWLQFTDISVSEVVANSMIGVGFGGTAVIIAYPAGSPNPAGIYMGGNTGSGGNVLWMEGGTLNMSTGSGTGGTTLNMDGGNIYGSAPGTGNAGGTLNLGDGSGSYGGTLNVEEGTLNMQGGTLNMDQGVLAFDNVASAQGDGAGTLTFTGVASVVGLPGISTLNLASVLSNGNNAAGTGINMNTGGGTGGGTLNMDEGSIRNCSALLGYAGLLRVPTTVNMLAYTLNMYDGGGTGGGTLNMDDGSIRNCGALLGNAGLLRVPTTVNMLGYTLNMYDGSGSGGGALNLDHATLAFDNVASVSGNGAGSLDFTGVTAVTGFPGLAPSLDLVLGTGNDAAGTGINMNAGGGTGGGTLSMDGGSIYGSALGSGQPGGTWSLGDGTGSHGGTLNMDDGNILNCDAIYGYGSTLKVSALNLLGYPLGNAGTLQLNATTAPGSPSPGTMYFDASTNKMNYWNGSAWVAW